MSFRGSSPKKIGNQMVASGKFLCKHLVGAALAANRIDIEFQADALPKLEMKEILMKLRTAAFCVIMCLTCTGALKAHHSDRMIDSSTAVRLTGTVLRYEPINPHAMIYLEVAGEDGQAQTWAIEGPRLLRVQGLGLAGDIVQAGDVITICGFYPVSITVARQTKPLFIHGKILVTPDGQKWAWGPYGRLNKCVNEDEWDSIASGTNRLRP